MIDPKNTNAKWVRKIGPFMFGRIDASDEGWIRNNKRIRFSLKYVLNPFHISMIIGLRNYNFYREEKPEPVVHERRLVNLAPLSCSIYIERYPEMYGSAWEALPFRSRLAWRVRNFANRIDKKLTYALEGFVPKDTTQEDLWDAMSYGVAAAQQYLIDLRRDRSVEVPEISNASKTDDTTL